MYSRWFSPWKGSFHCQGRLPDTALWLLLRLLWGLKQSTSLRNFGFPEDNDWKNQTQLCQVRFASLSFYMYIYIIYIYVYIYIMYAYTCIYIVCTIFAKWYMLHEAKANILRRSRAGYISEIYGYAQGIQNGNTTCCRMGYGYFTMDSKSMDFINCISAISSDFHGFESCCLFRRGLWARGQLHS